AENLAAELDQRIPEYRLANVNFVEALIHIASDFKLPMGIAWVNTHAARSKSDFGWRNLTVREILEAVAQSQSDYDVVVANGVVHVLSNAMLAEQNWLLLRLPSFHAQGVPNMVHVILWRELNSRVDQPKQGYAGSVLSSANDPKLNLTFTNSTVGEIFDSVALASDRKIWVVTFEDSLALTPTGFRRSKQLSSRNPI